MILLWALAFGQDMPVTSESFFLLHHPKSEHYLATSAVRYPESDKNEVSGVRDRTHYWRFRTEDSARVRCGSTVQLQHIESKRFLATSQEPAVMSRNNKQVSTDPAFNLTQQSWVVECKGTFLTDQLEFSLKHRQTERYLRMSKFVPYAYSKYWAECPIQGRLEASSVAGDGPETKFIINYGYFVVSEEQPSSEEQGRPGSQDL